MKLDFSVNEKVQCCHVFNMCLALSLTLRTSTIARRISVIARKDFPSTRWLMLQVSDV